MIKRLVQISLLLITFLPLSGWASETAPVWSQKPVFTYLILTPSVRRTLTTDTGLSQRELDAVYEIAHSADRELQALLKLSDAIAFDQNLSPNEKQQQIAALGFNQQVVRVNQNSLDALKDALRSDSYAQLLAWIERRWAIERQLHGLAHYSPQKSVGARTYSIYTTRYRTEDYTVAIPDKCIKFANLDSDRCEDSGYETGQHYAVHLSYTDSLSVTRALTVEVRESGPWNIDDNFWAASEDPHPRRLFMDLPPGMPQAQAAFFDNYNNGLDQYGRLVIAPFALDLHRQVSFDIGLNLENDWVDITYLWTEGWDSEQVEVVQLDSPTQLTPAYQPDLCLSGWAVLSPPIKGSSTPAYLSLNALDQSGSSHAAVWIPDLPEAGEYQVLAYIPNHDPVDWQCPDQHIPGDTRSARYTVHHAAGETTVEKNQLPMAYQWLDLGTYLFAAGTAGKVTLTDVTGETAGSRTVAFSAVQFRRLTPSEAPPIFSHHTYLPLLNTP